MTCSDNSSVKVCTSCKPNAELSAGNCVFQSNFYLSATSQGNCIPCTGLCKECEETNSRYRCKSCKDNATLDYSAEVCSCNPTFYLSTSDLNACKSCTGLCEECKEVDSKYKCTSCKENASLDIESGICECNDEYYLSPSSPRQCLSCSSLCTKCEERSGSPSCTECKDFARLESNDCMCIEGYYQPYSDPKPLRCYECPVNCETCEEDRNGVYCTSCKENAILNQGNCECIEGYYLYDEITYNCKVCEGLCKTCNIFDCSSCVENAELIDGKCTCKEGYYQSLTDRYACTPCSNKFCKTCQEKEREYKCTSCIDPYILSYLNLCICNEEYYYTEYNTCIPIDFSLELIPSLNKLELVFSQSLKDYLLFQDLSHEVLDREISPQLTTNFYNIEDRLAYGISYNSHIQSILIFQSVSLYPSLF